MQMKWLNKPSNNALFTQGFNRVIQTTELLASFFSFCSCFVVVIIWVMCEWWTAFYCMSTNVNHMHIMRLYIWIRLKFDRFFFKSLDYLIIQMYSFLSIQHFLNTERERENNEKKLNLKSYTLSENGHGYNYVNPHISLKIVREINERATDRAVNEPYERMIFKIKWFFLIVDVSSTIEWFNLNFGKGNIRPRSALHTFICIWNILMQLLPLHLGVVKS